MNSNVLYRFVTHLESEYDYIGFKVEKSEYKYLKLLELPIIKETEKGYWIDINGYKKRFVHKERGKFAYNDKEKALMHFIERQHKRINFGIDELYKALNALQEIKALTYDKQTDVIAFCNNVLKKFEKR